MAVEAYQDGPRVVLVWDLYRAPVGEPALKPWRRRRVHIQHSGPLSAPQLTQLAVRMGGFVLSGLGAQAAVPRGLPWHEVGGQAGSVPPGGGEGGANPA